MKKQVDAPSTSRIQSVAGSTTLAGPSAYSPGASPTKVIKNEALPEWRGFGELVVVKEKKIMILMMRP